MKAMVEALRIPTLVVAPDSAAISIPYWVVTVPAPVKLVILTPLRVVIVPATEGPLAKNAVKLPTVVLAPIEPRAEE